jgi:F0F1-type ATP synthase assembly protein I
MSPAQALIAAMLSPALLILAAGSLIAAALIRLGRVVDRVRVLGAAAPAAISLDELARHEQRARLALAAITSYFIAVALFVGAGIAIALDRAAGGQLVWLPIGLTLAGMVLLVVGVAAMALESRASSALIAADIAALRRRVTPV